MTNDNQLEYTVIKTEDGQGTGDRILTTADGRKWETWDGIERTGQEVAKLYF